MGGFSCVSCGMLMRNGTVISLAVYLTCSGSVHRLLYYFFKSVLYRDSVLAAVTWAPTYSSLVRISRGISRSLCSNVPWTAGIQLKADLHGHSEIIRTINRRKQYICLHFRTCESTENQCNDFKHNDITTRAGSVTTRNSVAPELILSFLNC
jgi:hypothetical protein